MNNNTSKNMVELFDHYENFVDVVYVNNDNGDMHPVEKTERRSVKKSVILTDKQLSMYNYMLNLRTLFVEGSEWLDAVEEEDFFNPQVSILYRTLTKMSVDASNFSDVLTSENENKLVSLFTKAAQSLTTESVL